jgi:hypothetical protein
MKKTLLLMLSLLLISVFSSAPPVGADETQKPAELKKTNEARETISDELKFSFGGDIRYRYENWTNVTALGTNPTTQKDRNFMRLRMSLWGQADMGKYFDAYTRITTEPKYYMGPYHPPVTGQSHGLYTDQDEVFVDNFYLSGKKLFNGLLDFRVGRQDFLSPEDMYGEGFLIFDGTPGDGSRSFYFNAAKVRLNITKKNSIDFVYITDMDTDVMMPSIHPAVSGNSGYINNKRLLTTSHEQAAVVYSRNKIGSAVTFDPYYIFKIEDGFLTNPRLQLHTFGGRITFSSGEWRVRGELAYQFGEYDNSILYPQGIDRTGLGGYFFVGRTFKDTSGKPEIDLGVVYYSGDDPNDPSNRRSAFDPLFARSPIWNELYVYTLVSENSAKYANGIPGYWTNLAIFMLKGMAHFNKSTSLTATYQYLLAPEKTSGLSTTMFSNNSRDRGHLMTAILNKQILKNLVGMLQFEYFIPGKFYASNTDNASFFRLQLQYKF